MSLVFLETLNWPSRDPNIIIRLAEVAAAPEAQWAIVVSLRYLLS